MPSDRPEFKTSILLEQTIRQLEDSQEPRDRAQGATLKMMDLMSQEVVWQSGKIGSIEEQTKRTNGRVDKGEDASKANDARITALEASRTFVMGFLKALAITGGITIGAIKAIEFVMAHWLK